MYAQADHKEGKSYILPEMAVFTLCSETIFHNARRVAVGIRSVSFAVNVK